jgi:penicillin-binding protein 1A
VAAVAWVGFDQPKKLGDRETGGGLALPIWVSYMGKALRNTPDKPVEPPQGIVNIGGELYYAETKPGQGVSSLGLSDGGVGSDTPGSQENRDQTRDQVF